MQHTSTQTTLGNGVTLITIPLLGTEAVTTMVLMGVGSRYESDDQQGLAHFTEHMVFKGGVTYPTAQSISQTLDAVGGEFNAFTSQDFTGFYTKTAARHFSLGVGVLADMVLHASFPEGELEKEKGVIVEEINMYEDIPMRRVDQVLSTLLYGDTPMGRPITGTKETVTRFTREDFVKYREQFYYGYQCTVIVAGAIDPRHATEVVGGLFAEMPAGEHYAPVPAAFTEGIRVAVEARQSEQTHLQLAVHAYPVGSPQRYAYRVLATILGGNMSSRLFTSVREEQGLCYYIRAYPDASTDTGLLVIGAGVDSSRLPQAVSAIMAELRLLKDGVVDAEELDRAKQFMIGKMLLGLEDSEQVAEFYGMQQVLERKALSPEEVTASIEAVTAEAVHAVAQELFIDERLRLAVVGPGASASELEALLTI